MVVTIVDFTVEVSLFTSFNENSKIGIPAPSKCIVKYERKPKLNILTSAILELSTNAIMEPADQMSNLLQIPFLRKIIANGRRMMLIAAKLKGRFLKISFWLTRMPCKRSPTAISDRANKEMICLEREVLFKMKYKATLTITTNASDNRWTVLNEPQVISNPPSEYYIFEK